MSRRVQDKHSLDFYTDFIIDPGVILYPFDEYGALYVLEYGTGVYNVANPWSMTSSESGHPGVGKINTITSDNEQTWLKCGARSLLKDYTRFVCTFRLAQMPSDLENGWMQVGLSADNNYGTCSVYLYQGSPWYPDPKGYVWTAVHSPDGPNISVNIGNQIPSENKAVDLIAWHTCDIRLDYASNVIQFYFDGVLISTIRNLPELVWGNYAYPSIWGGDVINNYVMLVDEIGWSTVKGDPTNLPQVSQVTKTMFSGSTRKDGRG